MIINYTPIRSDHLIKIEGESLFIKHGNVVNKVDFSSFPDGKIVDPIAFISSAEKIDGELTATLCLAVDIKGTPIEQKDFDISEYTDIKVIWKTQDEIEAEKNMPKEPTIEERLLITEDTINFLLGL